MGKSKNAVAVSESGIPAFSRLNGEPCGSCGLEMCLPDHSHPARMVYHVEAGRFLPWPQIEAMNGANEQGLDLSKMPTDRKALAEHEAGIRARQEERRRKTKERNRRYRQKKGQRHVLNPPKSDL